MKKYILSIFTIALFAVGFVASDEEESANNTNKEQKQETKEKVEEKKEDNIFGTYEVTDKEGTTLLITLNEDESATVKIKGSGKTYYCYWRDYRSIKDGISVSFEGGKERPIPVFEGGIDEHSLNWIIKDGWLYSYYDTARANNPEWRLKATKIK